MFKRIIGILVIFAGCVNMQGYAQTDVLRNRLNGVPDSAKAAVLIDIAKTYETNDVDSCLFYARLASEMAQNTEQYPVLIDAETILSRIASENKEYLKTTNHQKNILNAALHIRDWNMVAQGYYDLAQTWLLRSNYAEAIDNLKKGLEVAEERNNPELRRDYYQALVNAYRKLYNVDAVCEYYSMLVEVNRQIDAETLNNRMAAMQTEYDKRAAELETQLSHTVHAAPLSPVTGIIIIWTVLVTLLLAAAIIYYRYRITAITVKNKKILDNTIQEIDLIKHNQETAFRFLTDYAYTGIDNMRDSLGHFVDEQSTVMLPVAGNTLNRINNEVFALYGFFQNFLLLLQAQSGQLKPEPATVNVPQLTANLLADYEPFAATNDIQLVNDVQNNVFALADERLIDTVLRNMMSNAFKYAPQGGLITLGAKENYTDVEIWVTDDGIGLTPEQAAKLFELSENLSLPGDVDIKGFGLGLAVCKALIETCKGRIWAETKPGEGFCIRFSLPKAENREMKVPV
jgi:signal transduction histidine kinase